MDFPFWLLAAFCAILIVALGFALQRLYFFQSGASGIAARPVPDPSNLAKVDELLSILLSIQKHGVSQSGAVSREDFSAAVLESACRLMGLSKGTVMLWNEKQACLGIVASKGLAPETTKNFSLKTGEGVAGTAFQTGKPVFVSDPAKDSLTVKKARDLSEPFISLPLLVQSKPVGVLNLHSEKSAAPFSDLNVKFLTVLASEAAVTLQNLELFDNLQTFYLEMVQTLARAVDSKDAYTHQHSDRARLKARRIGQELQLPDQMARYIEYAALLHDIGKIGIDESILLKPGKLTAEEYEVMKRHPVIGHQILSPVKFLGPVAQMVLYHQEWYNGQGYPDGLKGDAIPMGARIVAVIDAWDAMMSDRPYRKALGRDKALGELKKGAGTQFDPKVGEVFLKLEDSEWRHERHEH